MAARIVGGIVGWLLSLLPLVAVNVADYFGLFSYDEAALAAAAALFFGLLLGGIVSGRIGGRRRADGSGGAGGASLAGGIAALLYSVTLIGLMIGSGYRDTAPPLIAEHPLRISVVIVFFAALLLAIAFITGLLMGRRADAAVAAQTSLPTDRRQAPVSNPNQRNGDLGSYSAPRTQPRYDTGREGNGGRYNDTRPRSPEGSDPRYAAARPSGQFGQYGQPSRPAHRSEARYTEDERPRR
jgi:hypothetical protein